MAVAHSSPLIADFAVVLCRHGDTTSDHGTPAGGRLPEIIRVATEGEALALLDQRMMEPHPYHAGHVQRADAALTDISARIHRRAYA